MFKDVFFYLPKSMTGYGRGEFVSDNTKFTCEIRTVNHRFLDINIKAGRQYSFIEDSLRTLISEKLVRGKVDISISAEHFGETDRRVEFDLSLVKSYFDGLKDLASYVGAEFDIKLKDVVSLPEVLKIVEVSREAEDIWKDISQAVIVALSELDSMRSREGVRITSDILDRLKMMEDGLSFIESRSKTNSMEHAEKLKLRIADLLNGVKLDEDRIAMEVAIIADKSDYTEEIVRFRSHISQFRDIIQENASIGRKLDFLTQEINREINTIGSKAQDLEVTNLVVNIKSEIEKIREQIQNIE